jgi:putative transposase
MKERHGNHTVTRLTAHLVWITKYRYHVLKGEIQKRCRVLLIQVCDSEDVRILKGVVSKDHVHMHIEYSPSKSISDLVKRLKGRSSRLLQKGVDFLINKPFRADYVLQVVTNAVKSKTG